MNLLNIKEKILNLNAKFYYLNINLSKCVL